MQVKKHLVLIFIAVLAGYNILFGADFANYTGLVSFPKIAKPVTPPLYGIVKDGYTMTFLPYTSLAYNSKNVITYLKPQTPVVITAESTDGLFYFAETSIVSGFLPKNSIITIDSEIFGIITEAKKGLVKEPIIIDDLRLPIATKLPIFAMKKKQYKVRVFTPDIKDVWLTSKQFTKPLPINRENLVKTTLIFKKKPYCWGSNENAWDCSGLLMDYFAFFDIDMPRNSYQQINFFDKLDVSDKTLKEKEKILKKSKPYLTLLYFPGHIMLYTGKKGEEFMTFQALNRIGNKRYGLVGYFPLKKTGLLSRVTKIGFIKKENQNLTYHLSEAKIKVSN